MTAKLDRSMIPQADKMRATGRGLQWPTAVLKVTAEGVENSATALALTSLGCARIQGGYVSPPMTSQEIIALEKGGRGLSSVTLRPQADEKADPESLS